MKHAKSRQIKVGRLGNSKVGDRWRGGVSDAAFKDRKNCDRALTSACLNHKLRLF